MTTAFAVWSEETYSEAALSAPVTHLFRTRVLRLFKNTVDMVFASGAESRPRKVR